MTNNPSPFACYQQRRIFGTLDGIRALSILAVIWHHTVPASTFSLPMLGRGFLGVDMFFVLSGFLIVTLLLRERQRCGSISLKNFYARRTLRIFPVYYAVLASLTTLYLLTPGAETAPDFFSELPYHATYTSNWIDASVFGITWSLATEEQFYLFWPPVERFLKRLALPILTIAIAFCQLVNFGVLDSWLEEIFGEAANALPILQTTFTPICLGVFLAHLLHQEKWFRILHNLFGKKYSPGFHLLLVCVLCNVPAADISGALRLGIQLSMAGLLASVVCTENHHLKKFLRMHLLRKIGMVSYGMYLFHIFLVGLAVKALGLIHLENPFATFLLTTALTFLVAEISFRFFESPVLKLKKRFSR